MISDEELLFIEPKGVGASSALVETASKRDGEQAGGSPGRPAARVELVLAMRTATAIVLPMSNTPGLAKPVKSCD